MQNPGSGLIVARPGLLRESLQALLATIPQIEAVEVVDDPSTALKFMVRCQPSLVVMDFDPSETETWNLLERIRTAQPESHCVVLVDNVQQQQALQSASADVLMKGAPAWQLSTSIKRLMCQAEDQTTLSTDGSEP
jgi:DNA-binding NarL/FixJ family response regulator